MYLLVLDYKYQVKLRPSGCTRITLSDNLLQCLFILFLIWETFLINVLMVFNMK